MFTAGVGFRRRGTALASSVFTSVLLLALACQFSGANAARDDSTSFTVVEFQAHQNKVDTWKVGIRTANDKLVKNSEIASIRAGDKVRGEGWRDGYVRMPSFPSPKRKKKNQMPRPTTISPKSLPKNRRPFFFSPCMYLDRRGCRRRRGRAPSRRGDGARRHPLYNA